VYSLLDRNGWPVTSEEEEDIFVVDLARDSALRIRFSNGYGTMTSITDSVGGSTTDSRYQSTSIVAEVKKLKMSNKSLLTSFVSFTQ